MLRLFKKENLNKNEVKKLRKKILTTLKQQKIKKSQFLGVLRDGYNEFRYVEYEDIERLIYCASWAIEIILYTTYDLTENNFQGGLSWLSVDIDGKVTSVHDFSKLL